ncbi:phosphotransferase family protein [Candidatus Entotheonella palauensis]|uniref:phosphotransferase family protein n=1 Tax=Candidatus Entotheonella palauensis TaxID=93172 RepID=UPI000B7CF255|nr:phosphotransferase [Candidatus Entotheonella palauensis]
MVKRAGTAAEAHRLVARIFSLRASGVMTPEAAYDAEAKVLRFPFIEGVSGLSRLAIDGWVILPTLLLPLKALHETTLPDLVSYDPTAKIRKRMNTADSHVLYETLQHLLKVVSEPARNTPLHGDFHAGQLILDAQENAWLLDLDDLAQGPPEADLGNFAAHLATRRETGFGPVPRSFVQWLNRVITAYRDIGGACDGPLAYTYGQLALIRRGLKWRERGDTSVLSEIMAGMPLR